MTGRTYEALIREARQSLNAGHGVVLDATFSKREFRDRLREALGDENVKWIVAEANEATIRERLGQRDDRSDVVSDARREDCEALNARFESPDELPNKQVVDTCGEADEVVRQLLCKLAAEA